MIRQRVSVWVSIGLVFGLLIAGCADLERFLFPTLTPFPTLTLFPSKTSTATRPPTATTTPTPTTVPAARYGTALPVKSQPITAANANRLTLFAAWGRGVPQSAAWSLDGHWFGVTSTRGLYMFDFQEDRLVFQLEGFGTVRSIAFSPNGSLVAGGLENGQIFLWNPADGSLIKKFIGQQFSILSLAFSQNGSYLASSAWDGSLWLWDLQRGEPGHKIDNLRAPARLIGFSPEGDLLFAWSPSDPLKAWRISDEKILKDRYLGIDPRGNSGSSAAFSGDGKIFAVDQDRGVRIIYTADGTTRSTLIPPSGAVDRVALSPDGMYGVTLEQRTMNLWRTEDRSLVTTWQLEAKAPPGGIPLFSPDGKTFALVGEDILLWNVESPQEAPRRILAGFSASYPVSMQIDPEENSAMILLLDGRLRRVNLSTGAADSEIHLPESGLQALAFSPDLVYGAGSVTGNKILLWRLKDGVLLQTLKGHTRPAGLLAFNPQSNLLVSTGADRTVFLWQVPDGNLLARLPLSFQPARLQFSPDGSLLFASGAGSIQLWKAPDWKNVESSQGFTIAFAAQADTRAVARGKAEHEIIEVLPSGIGSKPLQIEDVQGTSLALSPDGNLVAALGSEISLWSALDGKKLISFNPQQGGREIFFTPDASLLGILAWDGSITLWGVP
jgi:WD40 repeat protein